VLWYFQVSLEHYPNEVFIHVSAARCWEMVRERVNQEITKQHKTGRTNLPPLQPPGSLDGFEMFGFSSPAIVQVFLQQADFLTLSFFFYYKRQMVILSCVSNLVHYSFSILTEAH
jgi:hypothetical protein